VTISREKRIELARKAGFDVRDNTGLIFASECSQTVVNKRVEKFAALVAAEATRWIPVGESKPEKEDSIIDDDFSNLLVKCSDNKAYFAHYSGRKFWHPSGSFEEIKNVTHWRYINLPEAS
jgi:hypothetical protein